MAVICAAPFLMQLLGVDFSSNSAVLPNLTTDDIGIDALYISLNGAFTHTILEWSAFSAALFIALLAIVHFRITREITTPIIAMALFSAGCIDAFHTLAADRLIDAVADNRNLIPFTWAISRSFNALILIIGVGILLCRPGKELKSGLPIVMMIMFYTCLSHTL